MTDWAALISLATENLQSKMGTHLRNTPSIKKSGLLFMNTFGKLRTVARHGYYFIYFYIRQQN